MILLEQYIELQIFHNSKLKKYKVIELLTDEEGVSFKIFYKDDYLFTLLPTMTDVLSFKLSNPNRMIAWDFHLYLKIEASLYSIFLNGPVS